MRKYIPFYALFIILNLLSFGSENAVGNDLDNAFPSFTVDDKRMVPTDFKQIQIEYEFDIENRTALGVATIKFTVNEAGLPLFDLIPTPRNVKLNNDSSVSVSLVSSPGSITRYRRVNKVVEPGEVHELSMQWNIDSRVSFGSGTARIGFFMGDLSDRNFFEKYAPASFEYDQYATNIVIRLKGADEKHQIYTNGTLNPIGNSAWAISFPETYVVSSYYLHLVNHGYFEEELYQLTLSEKEIPVSVYAAERRLVDSAINRIEPILRELENNFGPYGHDSLTVYVTSGGGGMEYNGATMTSMGALGHELTHSWFARGIMPASGNGAWIDEAIASWRDNGYPQYSSSPGKQNLASFSDYRRYTTTLAYSGGMRVIAHLDYLLKGSGGMKTVLKGLWGSKKLTTITTPEFKGFLESTTGKNVSQVFNQSVYNKSVRNQAPPAFSLHPRPYTEEELRRFQ